MNNDFGYLRNAARFVSTINRTIAKLIQPAALLGMVAEGLETMLGVFTGPSITPAMRLAIYTSAAAAHAAGLLDTSPRRNPSIKHSGPQGHNIS